MFVRIYQVFFKYHYVPDGLVSSVSAFQEVDTRLILDSRLHLRRVSLGVQHKGVGGGGAVVRRPEYRIWLYHHSPTSFHCFKCITIPVSDTDFISFHAFVLEFIGCLSSIQGQDLLIQVVDFSCFS